MDRIDIARWVNAESNPSRKLFREAVHVLLTAISRSPHLSGTMVMKGGILLALCYGSSRYTRDVDFSTRMRYQDFDLDGALSELRDALARAVGDSPYELECRLQSYELMPANQPEATFPTLRLRVGYASRANLRATQRLRAGGGSDIVQIDCSFNEVVQQVERLELDEESAVEVYSFIDLVAEKLRAILQQEVRNRNRRQDAYDVFRLLQWREVSPAEKVAILAALERSAESRGLAIGVRSLRDEAIRMHSAAEYSQLQAEISEPLTPFEETWDVVTRFYEGLPWDPERTEC